MKCAVHTEVDASGYCRNCGKALCPPCTREVRGALYCEECLAAVVAAPQAQQGFPAANPGLAATLGFIPGLGAVYNGEYLKALIHVLIFGGLIAIHNSIMNDSNVGSMVFIHIVLACFYFYMPIDSYRVAKARRLGAPEPGPILAGRARKPLGAIILIAVGILFLLGNFGWLDWDLFGKVWPAGLIVLGVWMLWCRLGRNS